MSRNAVAEESIQGYFSAIDSGDIDRVLSFFDPSVVYERPGYEMIAGLAALRTFFQEKRIIRDGRHTIAGMLSDEDRVACWGHFEGTLKSGAAIDLRFSDVYRFSGRLIERRTTFFFTPLA